jgi:hypothetical protein
MQRPSARAEFTGIAPQPKTTNPPSHSHTSTTGVNTLHKYQYAPAMLLSPAESTERPTGSAEIELVTA